MTNKAQKDQNSEVHVSKFASKDKFFGLAMKNQSMMSKALNVGKETSKLSDIIRNQKKK